MEKITRFERTRLISARALQLALGAPPLIKVPKDAKPEDITLLELEKKVLPLAILRDYPNGDVRKIEVY